MWKTKSYINLREEAEGCGYCDLRPAIFADWKIENEILKEKYLFYLVFKILKNELK